MQSHGWPHKTCPYVDHTAFVCSNSHGVGNFTKLWSMGLCPLRWGHVDPLKVNSPPRVTIPNLVILGQSMWAFCSFVFCYVKRHIIEYSYRLLDKLLGKWMLSSGWWMQSWQCMRVHRQWFKQHKETARLMLSRCSYIRILCCVRQSWKLSLKNYCKDH